MLTREVREWLQKIERRQYSYDDAMYEFLRFAPYLTRYFIRGRFDIPIPITDIFLPQTSFLKVSAFIIFLLLFFILKTN